MIRLGLRLTLAGGREAAARLAVIVVAVAVGAALLFVTVAGTNAVDAQNQRWAWLETGYATDSLPGATDALPGAPGSPGDVDPVWWRLGVDNYDGDDIGRIDVAVTGPDTPVPPGMDALPGPGEYVASPALAELMASVPASQLADRYPGRLVDVMDRAALASPDALLVVVGRPVGDLADDPEASQITSISSTAPDACSDSCALGFGIDAQGTTLVLGVVVAALLFPVLVFIGSATRLSAARREQRFAAMRLVGATPRQVDVLSTVESTAASALGLVGGLGLFVALRSSVARIPFTGTRFYLSDLSLRPGQVLVIAVGVPLAAAVAARIALRRAQSSPLATGRRSEPQRPRATRLIPLAAGLGELAWFAVNGRPSSVDGQLSAYLSGVLLTMTGLVVAGPWFTLHGSQLLARHSRRPVGLIAGRRLSDDPQAGFRAVSGLVLALFIGSGAIGTIVSIRAASSPQQGGSTLVVEFDRGESGWGVPAATLPPTLFDRLDAVPGVEDTTVIHARSLPPEGEAPLPYFGEARLVTCAQLDRTPSLGRCEPGATTALVHPDFTGPVTDGAPQLDDVTWPDGNRTPAQVEDLPVVKVVVENDGSTTSVELARTVLETSLPDTVFAPATIGELNQHSVRPLLQYQQLADVVIGANLAIAGCSLAVSVVAGLNDRRRPFSLLRLSGTPLTMLRRVVAVEAVVPLLATAAIAAGVGFLTAGLFIRAQMDRSLAAPGSTYFLVVAIGLAGSLAVIASTLPLLDRLTGPEAARND